MTSSRSTTGAMLTWLTRDLAANRQPWIIAFWHHPPYSKGSHNSDTETQLIEMRTNVLPILEANGVDLVLSGHSHAYERSKLIGGHYGLSTTLAADMIKDGGSGRPETTGAYAKATDPYRAVYAVAGSSGQTGADVVMAWPSAEIAVMGAEGAAKIIFRKEDPENLKKKTQEYIENFATPYQAARHGLIEQVIEPKETRPMIIRALKMLENKKEDRPWKKHGNIPL
jgi:hypothetical protein